MATALVPKTSYSEDDIFFAISACRSAAGNVPTRSAAW
jgi:hypothetical protein